MFPEFAVGSIHRPTGMSAPLTGGVPDEEGVRNVSSYHHVSFSVQGTGPQVEEASEKQCTNQIFNLKVAVLADEVDDR